MIECYDKLITAYNTHKPDILFFIVAGCRIRVDDEPPLKHLWGQFIQGETPVVLVFNKASMYGVDSEGEFVALKDILFEPGSATGHVSFERFTTEAEVRTEFAEKFGAALNNLGPRQPFKPLKYFDGLVREKRVVWKGHPPSLRDLILNGNCSFFDSA